jgi:hydrogenase/urease accessory protein HupE
MSGVARALLLMSSLLSSVLAMPAQAHLLAPALLELTQTGPGEYAVHWRVSALGTQRLSLRPRLPASCTESAPEQSAPRSANTIDLVWTARCAPADLAGATLAVEGLAGSGVSVILRIATPISAPVKALLDEAHPSFTLGAAPSAGAVFGSYLQLGVGHLLTGFDHLLFLLGLLLLVRNRRMLIVTVTAFTLGHSVTLTLATLGIVHVPQALAELAIAITIIVLAQQLARQNRRASFDVHALPSMAQPQRVSIPPARPSMAGRSGSPRAVLAKRDPSPLAMAFVFGLLHGLGFAGALTEIGLPQEDLPLSLFAFNVGIELAQLAIIALALTLAALWQRLPLATPRSQNLLRWAAAYGIGALAALWCCERAALLWA